MLSTKCQGLYTRFEKCTATLTWRLNLGRHRKIKKLNQNGEKGARNAKSPSFGWALVW